LTLILAFLKKQTVVSDEIHLVTFSHGHFTKIYVKPKLRQQIYHIGFWSYHPHPGSAEAVGQMF